MGILVHKPGGDCIDVDFSDPHALTALATDLGKKDGWLLLKRAGRNPALNENAAGYIQNKYVDAIIWNIDQTATFKVTLAIVPVMTDFSKKEQGSGISSNVKLTKLHCYHFGGCNKTSWIIDIMKPGTLYYEPLRAEPTDIFLCDAVLARRSPRPEIELHNIATLAHIRYEENFSDYPEWNLQPSAHSPPVSFPAFPRQGITAEWKPSDVAQFEQRTVMVPARFAAFETHVLNEDPSSGPPKPKKASQRRNRSPPIWLPPQRFSLRPASENQRPQQQQPLRQKQKQKRNKKKRKKQSSKEIPTEQSLEPKQSAPEREPPEFFSSVPTPHQQPKPGQKGQVSQRREDPVEFHLSSSEESPSEQPRPRLPRRQKFMRPTNPPQTPLDSATPGPQPKNTPTSHMAPFHQQASIAQPTASLPNPSTRSPNPLERESTSQELRSSHLHLRPALETSRPPSQRGSATWAAGTWDLESVPSEEEETDLFMAGLPKATMEDPPARSTRAQRARGGLASRRARGVGNDSGKGGEGAGGDEDESDVVPVRRSRAQKEGERGDGKGTEDRKVVEQAGHGAVGQGTGEWKGEETERSDFDGEIT